MSLLQILSKYKKEDAIEMERESQFSTDPTIGLSMDEKRLLKRLNDNSVEDTLKREFGIKDRMSSQSIEVER